MDQTTIKYYNINDVVSISDNMIGVVKEGTMHVKSHSIEILDPFTIARLDAGSIIGHHTDEGLTTFSENWILNYTNNTEVVWF
jgi:hypothetical protein